MRKKLAVILAATLALQSFTVPAFAGEQYDEVVEVIEDAEGLEAAEDISDDEDIDIDINYGDDTAETFDETAVDVASAEGEEDDAEYLDIVEEGVEEEADVAAGTVGQNLGEFKDITVRFVRDGSEWIVEAAYTFDGVSYTKPVGTETYDHATEGIVARSNDKTGRLSVTWHYASLDGLKAVNDLSVTSVDIELSGDDTHGTKYARFKGVKLQDDVQTGSGTYIDKVTPVAPADTKTVTVWREISREDCGNAQQIGKYEYTLAADSTFVGSTDANVTDAIKQARTNVILPPDKDVVKIKLIDIQDGYERTNEHTPIYDTTLYVSDNYETSVTTNPLMPSRKYFAVNTKKVGDKVVLVRNDKAGLYVEKTRETCLHCARDITSYYEVLVLPNTTMSKDSYLQNADDLAATETSIIGYVESDDLTKYATWATGAPIPASTLSVADFAKYTTVLSDCSKSSHYYIVTPKKELDWDSDVKAGMVNELKGGLYAFSNLKIVEDGKTLDYSSFADWNQDTRVKVTVDKHDIEKTYLEAVNAADDKYLSLQTDGTVKNLNCAKAIDYYEVTYCVYHNAGYAPSSVGTAARNYSGDVSATAPTTNNKFKEVKRSEKKTAAKGTTHYPDTVFEEALNAKTAVILPVQDSTYALTGYILTYNDGTHVYSFEFGVPDKATGKTSVQRKKDGTADITFDCIFRNNTSTCEADGTVDVVLFCTVCGEEAEAITVKMQKHHEKTPEKYTREIVTPATCTEEGVDAQVKKCEICERELERKEVPSEKIPHDFKDQATLLAVNTGNVVIWNGAKTGQNYTLKSGYNVFGHNAEEYEIEIELYKLCKSCGEAKQYWNYDNLDVNGNLIAEGFEEKTMKGSLVLDKVEPQDELGNNGTITYTVTYNYQDAKGETATLTKTETKPYYTDFTSYLDRYANDDAKALIANLAEIPDVDKLTLDDAKAVEDAVAAYKALAPNQRELVDEATDGKVAKAQAKIEELIAEQKETVKKNLDAAVKAAESATAGSEAQKEALENLDKAIATAKVAGIDTAAAEKTLKDQQAVYDKAAAAIAAAEKAAAAAQANPTAENIKAAEDAIAAAKAAGVADADLKKATDAEKAAEKAKKDADDKKIADAVKAAEAAANAAKANPTAATVKAAEDAIAAAKKAGATDAQLANAKAATDAAKKAAEPKDATIKVSKTTVKKGKKTTIKITSDAGTKITVTAANKKAKNKKSVKIKSGTTAKLTFKKAAKKGTYKFKVSTAAVGNFKATSKTIKIKVK